MAKQIKKFAVGQGTYSPPQSQSIWVNNTTTSNHSVSIGSGQTIEHSFQFSIGDGDEYQETFDIRSMFLLIKTMLKELGYDEKLIYTKYDDLKIILNRELSIDEILNCEDEQEN